MKYKVFILIAIAIIVVFLAKNVAAPFDSNSKPYENWNKISIGGKVLNLEVVWTQTDREKGLSGRRKLAGNTGMLFVFEKPRLYSFWMKGMNFPIDIIWLDGDGQVIYIKEKAEPSSYPQSYAPDSPAQMVLETNAGFVASAGIKIGDQAEILR